MKRLLALFLLLIIATPAFASTQPLITRSTTTRNAITVMGFNTLSPGAGGVDQRNGIFAVAGVISNLEFNIDTVPGGTGTWTATVQQNGSNTTMTCTITSALLSCTDPAHPITVTAGDYIDVRATIANAPAAATLYARATFTPTTSGQIAVLAGSATITSVTGTRANQVAGSQQNVTEITADNAFPEAGTLSQMWTTVATAFGAGNTYSFTERTNAVSDTNLTYTISGASQVFNNDLTHSTTTDAVSLYSYQSNLTGGTGIGRIGGFGAQWVANNTGDFALIGSVAATADTANPNYIPCQGTGAAFQPEASSSEIVDAMTITTLTAHLRVTTGAAKSFLMTLRKNGADTGLSCNILNAISCTVNGSVSFAAGDTCDVSAVPSGTPAAQALINVALAGKQNLATPLGKAIFTVQGGFLKVISGFLKII